jgi:chemotaxis protein MotC
MAISQDKLADITAMMDPERETVIYLRIARRAAIDGFADLSAFASARAEQGRDGIHNQDDPRAQLYSSLSTVTSGTIDEVRAKLSKIDRSQLSQSDRDLLDAAQAVAGEVIAPPAPLPADKPAPAAVKQEPVKTAAAANPDEPELPPVEGAMPDHPAVAASGEPAATDSPKAPGEPATQAQSTPQTKAPQAPSVATASDAAPVLPASAPAAGAEPADPTDAAMAKTRRQLDLIDQMLGAAPK